MDKLKLYKKVLDRTEYRGLSETEKQAVRFLATQKIERDKCTNIKKIIKYVKHHLEEATEIVDKENKQQIDNLNVSLSNVYTNTPPLKSKKAVTSYLEEKPKATILLMQGDEENNKKVDIFFLGSTGNFVEHWLKESVALSVLNLKEMPTFSAPDESLSWNYDADTKKWEQIK